MTVIDLIKLAFLSQLALAVGIVTNSLRIRRLERDRDDRDRI